MKLRWFVLAGLLLLLALPTVLYAQTMSPEEVVVALLEAENAHDAEVGTALFADDATYDLVPPPPDGTYPLVGKEAIRARREAIAGMNSVTTYEIIEVNGNTVVTTEQYVDDEILAMGIDYLEGTVEYVVEDGKIQSMVWTATEETMAKLMAAMPPPETLPESGAATGVGYPLLMALGGLAILAGLANRRRRTL